MSELGCHMQISDKLWPGSCRRTRAQALWLVMPGMVGMVAPAASQETAAVVRARQTTSGTEARGGVAVVPSGDSWWPDSRAF